MAQFKVSESFTELISVGLGLLGEIEQDSGSSPIPSSHPFESFIELSCIAYDYSTTKSDFEDDVAGATRGARSMLTLFQRKHEIYSKLNPEWMPKGKMQRELNPEPLIDLRRSIDELLEFMEKYPTRLPEEQREPNYCTNLMCAERHDSAECTAPRE